MAGSHDVFFVFKRFMELRDVLVVHGWEVVERGDLSEWDEGRRKDPMMGVVRIRGHREWSLGGHVSFTIKEWWAWPPTAGPIEREGVVLAGYHYTLQSALRQVRYCLDPHRHPDMPFHVHPEEGAEPRRTDPITVEEALKEIEQRLAEELVQEVGSDFDEDDEDDLDAVFGEEDYSRR